MATNIKQIEDSSGVTHDIEALHISDSAISESHLEVTTNKGIANGYAGLGADGKVPAAQLPSFVDDVVDSFVVGSTAYASNWLSGSEGGSPITPETGKIYVIIGPTGTEYLNKTFRWSGSVYVEITSGGGAHVHPAGDLVTENATPSMSLSGTASFSGDPVDLSLSGSIASSGAHTHSIASSGGHSHTATISVGEGTANYTPAGTISTPTLTPPSFSGDGVELKFTGTSGSSTTSYTPEGTLNITGKTTAIYSMTSAGSVVNGSVTAGTVGTAATSSGSFTASVDSSGVLSFAHAHNFTANTPTTPTSVTLPTITLPGRSSVINAVTSAPTFVGTAKNVSLSFTPADSISVGTGTPNYTPSGSLSGGSVSQPTFSGTAVQLVATISGSGAHTHDISSSGAHTHSYTASGEYTPSGSVSLAGVSVTGGTHNHTISGTTGSN